MTAMHLVNFATGTAAVLLAASFGTDAGAATWRNVVQNGSFEQAFDHWDVSGPGAFQNPDAFKYTEGATIYAGSSGEFQFVPPVDNADGPTGNPGFDPIGEWAANVPSSWGIRQVVTLVPDRYIAGMDVFTPNSNFVGGGSSIYAWLGSRNLLTAAQSIPSFRCNNNGCQWAHYSVEFDVAVGGTAELLITGTMPQFAFADPIGIVDRVYVAVREVPEPSTCALLLLGLGALGFAARHKQRG